MAKVQGPEAHQEFRNANYELRPGGIGDPSRDGYIPGPVTVYFGTPGGIVEGYPDRADREQGAIPVLGRTGTQLEDL